MTKPRIVSCGEALIDLIGVSADGRRWQAAPGGAPVNVAVAAGRLGAPTSFVGVLSSDTFGGLLRAHLEESHVDHSHCPTTDEPTTLAVVDQPPGADEPSFTFHVAGTTTVSPRVNDLHLPSDLGIFHVSGSVSLVLEPAASRFEALLAAARRRGLVHLDPNPRPMIAGGREAFLTRLRRWRSHADVIKISGADLAWLHPESEPLDIARGWLEPAYEGQDVPAAIVVTRGADGAAVVRSRGVVAVPAPKIEVLDTVGAGDSFAGALLAAFSSHEIADRTALQSLDDAWWQAALGHAVRAAGIACGRVGADPPWRDELRRTS